MIKIDNLKITYGETTAVNQINAVIQRQEKISIVGRSGSGKTSVLHALAGLITPSSGKISIRNNTRNSTQNSDVNGIREDTAIILQKGGLFPWKNVEANVMLGMINEEISKEDKAKNVDGVLRELDIADQSEKYLHELSGGQRQRVAIARALVQSPDLLLMDEPTASLDMITKEKFQDSLVGLYNRHDITAVIVTHDIEEAVYLGQKILVMSEGRITAEIVNPYYGNPNIRESIEFYELCLKIRQVMKA